ncbi:hypothetical protein WR25_23848 [Diploscapter pachys]|uniref:Major facilitator superfamily (MFS) profile domain-containing protein n=1 Tax=Diploscapter pachys TaxID=2018661 RepID=A0A2A2KNH1_9BILA|nr:hypothetical protein WR25_23848 [Diploscapter pachys]
MGDKIILTEVLEASNLTDAYTEYTPQTLLNELRHIGEDFIVRYSDLDDRSVLGEPEDQRNHDEDKTFTVDDAVEHLGFGRFQLKLSLLTGCAWGLMFSTLMACSMGVISSLSTNFYTFLLFRGLTGFGIGGVSQSITLYSEFLPSAHRAKCVSLIESFCFWLPESARYYIASGKSDKALAILQKAARENRCQLPSGTLVASHSNTAEMRGDFSGLLTSEYRTTSLLLWIIWSVNAFCYYGNVQFATVLVQSHDECHGGNANGTQTTQCKPLTKDDYELLVYTTIA